MTDFSKKSFKDDFYKLFIKLKKNENFAYSRYSDGSMYVLQNKKLVLAENHFQIDQTVTPNHYFPEDYKIFDPEQHQFYQKKLVEAFQYKKHNYYVGISCKCCVGDVDNQWMRDFYFQNSDNKSEEFLTWANIWVNGNYSMFVQYMIPEFNKHDIVYIVNEKADLKSLPFEVKKDFRVGNNCFVNNYPMIEEIKTWIKENNIKNHVFLFSAADLSNLMIHQLFEEFDNNTYINIGTCLNLYIKLSGIRQYLIGNNKKICVW